jgi:hypothetical protein
MKIQGTSRRGFLRTAGVAVGLPLLESLLPRTARAQTASAKPRRIMAFYVANGIHMPHWIPAQTGASFTLPTILEPLAPVRDKVLVLSGLGNWGASQGGERGRHAPGCTAFLSCVPPLPSLTQIRAGISMDQVYANHIGRETRFASLQLGTQARTNPPDGDYSAVYSENISWAGPTSPMPKMVSPRGAFEVLFSGNNLQETAAEAARRRAYKTSVLDVVLDQIRGVQGKLGHTDQQKLDEYFTGVRELEERLAKPVKTCTVGAAPAGGDLQANTKAMLDLMALAAQCDLTRAMTFMLNNAGSNSTFPFLGINRAHHGDLSHHKGDASKQALLSKINRWEVGQLAYLLQKLNAIDDGDGTTALDNSMVYFSSEIADGNSHSHANLPVILAGKGGGKFQGGRHIAYGNARMADLFISMLQAAGMPITKFGSDGVAPLPGLTG